MIGKFRLSIPLLSWKIELPIPFLSLQIRIPCYKLSHSNNLVAVTSRPVSLQPLPPVEQGAEAIDFEIYDPDDAEQSDEEDGPVTDPGKPVFERSMPGILTKDQILAEVDLDHIKLRIQDTDAETSDLVRWDTSDISSTHSIKGVIAELVAAVGSEAAREMVVYFS
jgi:arginyl-tRNA---protein transferase